MKNRIIYFLVGVSLAMVSCKEEPPAINYQPTSNKLDTTYMISSVPAAQPKEILLEDISGVQCINCPAASQIAKDLVAQYPGRINVMANQPLIASLNPLCQPVNKDGYKSKYDLRTDAGAAICRMVAVPGSLPNGYINRKVFAGKADPLVPKEEWAADVNSELSVATPVNIEFTKSYEPVTQTYNPLTKTLTVEVTITYTQNVTGQNYVSIAIVEDSIVDVQETRDQNGMNIWDPNYLQEHIIRDMFTTYTGDLLNKTADMTLVPGRVFKKRYSKVLTNIINSNDVEGHVRVLAWVHQDATAKYVLQSKQMSLIP